MVTGWAIGTFVDPLYGAVVVVSGWATGTFVDPLCGAVVVVTGWAIGPTAMMAVEFVCLDIFSVGEALCNNILDFDHFQTLPFSPNFLKILIKSSNLISE